MKKEDSKRHRKLVAALAILAYAFTLNGQVPETAANPNGDAGTDQLQSIVPSVSENTDRDTTNSSEPLTDTDKAGIEDHGAPTEEETSEDKPAGSVVRDSKPWYRSAKTWVVGGSVLAGCSLAGVVIAVVLGADGRNDEDPNSQPYSGPPRDPF